MKVQIKGGALNTAAAWTAKLAPNNPTLPLTSGVLLSATDELWLSATDLNTFGEVVVQSTMIEDGQMAVSAKLFASVAKTLGADSDVTLETVPRGLQVRCDRARWTLPALQGVEDWPSFPALTEPVGSIPADVLSKAVDRVLPTVATPDSSVAKSAPQVTGMGFELGTELTMVGTDSFRMAAAEVPWKRTPNNGEGHKLIVPADLLRLTLDACAGSHSEIELCTDGDTASFILPGYRITGRLIAGKYRPWRKIFTDPEKEAVTTVAVEVAELAKAVRQVGAVVDKRDVGDLVRLDLDEDEIRVSLVTGSDGEGDTAVDVHTWTGESLSIGVDHRYLLDALAGLDAPMAVMILTGEGSRPVMLRPADKDGAVIADGYGHVLMTRKLKVAP